MYAAYARGAQVVASLADEGGDGSAFVHGGSVRWGTRAIGALVGQGRRRLRTLPLHPARHYSLCIISHIDIRPQQEYDVFNFTPVRNSREYGAVVNLLCHAPTTTALSFCSNEGVRFAPPFLYA